MTAIDLPHTSIATALAPRSTMQAMQRGALQRCPACGDGSMFRGYLKSADHCAACNEALHHHRADDGPAYVTIMIIAHLFVPLLMVVYIVWRPPVFIMLSGFCIATVIATLALLPAVKGAFIGMQWARRMHGFDDSAPARPSIGDQD